MDKELWPVCIKNMVAVVTWALLAVRFDKWWIALFAVFFIGTIEAKKVSDAGGANEGKA